MSVLRKLSFLRCGSKTSTQDRRSSRPLVNRSQPRPIQSGERIEVECGVCQNAQLIGEVANAFVCDNCKSVNRVTIYPLGDRRVDVCTELEVNVPRMGVDAFRALDVDGDLADGPIVPQCSVCLDRCGDCVLLPCAHGALCEDCAVHIGSNLAVGGRHCPKCRVGIEQVVRVGRVTEEALKCCPVNIPAAESQETAPKASVPVGLERAKGQQRSYDRGATTSTDEGEEPTVTPVKESNRSAATPDTGTSD